ncbi:MAG: multicopper oxidase family protein [Beijerinckiaceae bacterium]
MPIAFASPSRRLVVSCIAATALPIRAIASDREGVTTLVAAPTERQIRPEPAARTKAWSYNGETPGPVIRIKRNQPATIRLENRLPQPTSLHFHGLRHANAFDGVAGLTQPAVEPGKSFDYKILAKDAGVSLYHPLVVGRTAEQVGRGLSGLLIVEEESWDTVDGDIAVVLDDWKLNAEHQLEESFLVQGDSARLGRLGNVLTVNGKPGPETFVFRPRARVRLRIAGAMNARVLPMRFEKMARATVLAIDGQPCDPFDPLRRQVIVAPGSRYDMVLELPETAGAETLVLVGLGDGLPVVRFTTDGEPLPARPQLNPLPPNPDTPAGIRLQEARRAEFSIAGGWDPKRPEGIGAPADVIARALPDPAKVWNLNHGFPSGLGGKPLFSVKRGQVVVVALTNRGAWPQVITVHGHVFRVLHAFDDGWEPFFLDTVVVPENRTVRIALVADNPGKWLIRSAILEHMEAGVLSWFEVTA